MNQAILFNDDHLFLQDQQMWRFTGLIAGDRITIYIKANNNVLTLAMKLNFEELVEDYLEDEEPNSHNEIWL
ncbi:hypothetical protein [Thalassotalea sp. ND16A]|uniref:hypothetical protein n=1 Tax=Thalassotalea sp. ND16A TaxID=1535422 RepID=UPI00051A264C|nr:hypothetical protein [Thalassotalea sp. ND16A]KGJ88239.1 hypothetical protein ND16A_2542 [Thalassotalea sp. ND16A]